jgi:hypothetical protein
MRFMIHVTPQLPPEICGLGDYATSVGRTAEAVLPEVRCGYIAAGRRVTGCVAESSSSRNVTGSCNPNHLWDAVDALVGERGAGAFDAVSLIIHCSGYGYACNGAPKWLAVAIENRPPQFGDVRIVTMFHELYATGWPWQRAFWASGRQRAVSARIARASDALMTNREPSARWLEAMSGRPRFSVPSLPVPSNVGEPNRIVPWVSRGPEAVSFGAARFKRPFFTGGGARATAAMCRNLGIQTLTSIGQKTEIDEAVFKQNGVEVVQTGFLPANEAAKHIGSARAALIEYFPGYFGKSSVLGGVAAHGTPPICTVSNAASDGLEFGIHFWDLKSAANASRNSAFARLSSISQSIRDWYDSHSLVKHAQLLAEVGNSEVELRVACQ